MGRRYDDPQEGAVIAKIQTAKFHDGRAPVVIVPEVQDVFQDREPAGYSREERRAVLLSGRYYLLAPDCPDGGVGDWVEHSPEEQAKDASLLSVRAVLSEEQLAAVGLADVQTKPERVAERLEAQATAAEAKATVAETEATAAELEALAATGKTEEKVKSAAAIRAREAATEVAAIAAMSRSKAVAAAEAAEAFAMARTQ